MQQPATRAGKQGCGRNGDRAGHLSAIARSVGSLAFTSANFGLDGANVAEPIAGETSAISGQRSKGRDHPIFDAKR